MKLGISRALVLVLLLACGSDLTGPTPPVTAFGVLMTVVVPGRCLVGGCDPISTEISRVGLVQVLNTGQTTVYIRSCGATVFVTEQELVGGKWVNAVTGLTCAQSPIQVPIALAAGDSLQLNWMFAPGRRRLVTSVASGTSLADLTLDASGSFDVH